MVNWSNSDGSIVMSPENKYRGGRAMRKLILASLAAFALGAAALVQPADAACWWNGFARRCGPPHHSWWWRHHHPYGPYGYGYGPHWWHHHDVYYRRSTHAAPAFKVSASGA